MISLHYNDSQRVTVIISWITCYNNEKVVMSRKWNLLYVAWNSSLSSIRLIYTKWTKWTKQYSVSSAAISLYDGQNFRTWCKYISCELQIARFRRSFFTRAPLFNSSRLIPHSICGIRCRRVAQQHARYDIVSPPHRRRICENVILNLLKAQGRGIRGACTWQFLTTALFHAEMAKRFIATL